MKPLFIIPPVDLVVIGKEKYTNNPINIKLVSSVVKEDFKLPPFDDNCVKLPSIHFKGIDLAWIFEKDDYKLRNQTYERILKEFGKDIFKEKDTTLSKVDPKKVIKSKPVNELPNS